MDVYRHPSQIYEAILDILDVPILLIVYRRKPTDGVVAWTWFTLYGITRSLAEIWREPDFTAFGLTGRPTLRAADGLHRRHRHRLLCQRPGPRTDARPVSPAPAARR